MVQKRPVRSSIVPGRKMITDHVAFHQAGMSENMSYLAEKTVLDESSTFNETRDVEERDWKKQGLTDRQIFQKLENKKLQRLKDAEERLNKEKFGAKNFDELLGKHEYSERESDEEDHTEIEEHPAQVFAIPSLPKHVHEKSMYASPVAGSRGNKKAGLSCSTPTRANDISMRSLKSLDISHVVNVDLLDNSGLTSQSKNVLVTIAEHSEHSSLQKTFTIPASQNSEQLSIEKGSSLQKTFTIDDDKRNSSLQNTFTVKNSEQNAESDGTLQKTYTVDEGWKNTLLDSTNEAHDAPNPDSANNNQDLRNDGALEKTQENTQEKLIAVVPDPVDEPTIVEDNIQGGGKKKSSKNKRTANSSMMSSMIEDIPSPGAGLFRNKPKKLKPTAKTPQRLKGLSRLSTESDKEKTIDMLSIAEEASLDNVTNGSSFVDPISVNITRVSPVPEGNEMDISLADTPKSRRRTPDHSSIREMVRARSILATPTYVAEDVTSPIAVTTPKNYLKPTFSSLVKNKNESERIGLFEATRKERRVTSDRNGIIPETNELETLNNEEMNEVTVQRENENIVGEHSENRNGSEMRAADISSPSLNNIHRDMDELTVREQPHSFEDVDFGGDNNADYDMQYNDDDYDRRSEHGDAAPGPSRKQRPKRKAVLLSDSIATVNTPGIERRSTRRPTTDDTIAEDWQPEEPTRRGNRKKIEKEMALKKRDIIEPVTPTDQVRRSKRTRVKPLRSWLGEQGVYVNSPSGGKRLTGVTDVIIKDKRLCKYRTADVRIATEREQKERAEKKKRAEQKRRDLDADHRKGRRLDETRDAIHTDDEDE